MHIFEEKIIDGQEYVWEIFKRTLNLYKLKIIISWPQNVQNIYNVIVLRTTQLGLGDISIF
jgi:hypothetical protein